MFGLDYAVVTFEGNLTGLQAKKFFDYIGTIDPALWSGPNAGFTQIALSDNGLCDSMLFLIGDVSTQEFTQGISKAVKTTHETTYSPRKDAQPTTATAGVTFPGNDWLASPDGEGYLSNLVNPSPHLLRDLAALRQQHLHAVENLLKAIDQGNVGPYLDNQFKCPYKP